MSSKGLLEKPKDFQNGLSIYCPQEIMDQFNFNKEVKDINSSNRLSRKLKVDTLRVNFILIVNMLSNMIPTNDDSGFTYIQSTTLRKIGSDKYYRVCIDMLKRSGFLYIRSYDKKETYSVGKRAKGYRWNKSKDQMGRMGVVYEHKVHEHKTKKKIIGNIEDLQCFKYSKSSLTKVSRKVSKYKRPYKFGKSKSGKYFWRDVAFIKSWYEKTIYMTSKAVNVIDTRKKYALQNYLFSAYGLVVKLKRYNNMTFSDLKAIVSSVEKRIYDCTGSYTVTGVDFRKFYDKSDDIHNIFATCHSKNALFRY